LEGCALPITSIRHPGCSRFHLYVHASWRKRTCGSVYRLGSLKSCRCEAMTLEMSLFPLSAPSILQVSLSIYLSNPQGAFFLLLHMALELVRIYAMPD
jgi:hypothetical protein